MLQQLQRIFKRIVVALRSDSLQRLNHKVLACAASVVLGSRGRTDTGHYG
jgi:hypothetical protein